MEQIRRASFAEAARRGGLDDDAFIDQVHTDYMNYRFRHLVHFPDVRPFLAAARKAGLMLALVTNGNTTAEKGGLADYLDASLVAYDVGFKKPDPRLYVHVVDYLGVPPETTIYIGDDPLEDVDAARVAGLSAVWLDRKHVTWPAGLRPPEWRRDTLADWLS